MALRMLDYFGKVYLCTYMYLACFYSIAWCIPPQKVVIRLRLVVLIRCYNYLYIWIGWLGLVMESAYACGIMYQHLNYGKVSACMYSDCKRALPWDCGMKGIRRPFFPSISIQHVWMMCPVCNFCFLLLSYWSFSSKPVEPNTVLFVVSFANNLVSRKWVQSDW